MYQLIFRPNLSVAEVLSQVKSNDFMLALNLYASNPETMREDLSMSASLIKLKEDRPLLSLAVVAFVFDFQSMVQEEIHVDVFDFLYHPFTTHMSYLVSRKGTRDLMFYIQEQYKRHFMAELVENGAENEELCGQAQGVTLKSLTSMVTSVAAWVPRKIKGVIGWSVETILESFREYFYKLIADKIPMAVKVCSWIAEVWEQVKMWITDAMSAMSAFLLGCEELLAWGVATLAAACALSILERILMYLDFITGDFDLVGMFLKTGVVAAACYHYTSKSKGFAEMMAVLSVAVSSVSAVVCQNYFQGKGSRQIKPQGGPVDLLMSIAEGLSNISNESILTLGKTSSAVNSIVTSTGHIRNFAGKILSMLRDFAWKVLGLETRFLADAALIFGEDVDGWLKSIGTLREGFINKAYSTQDEIMTMNLLLERGYKMRNIMATGAKITPAIGNMLMQGLSELERLHRNASLQGVRGVRKIPFTVFAYGASRCGKSLLVGKLIDDFQHHLGLGQESVYARNTIDPFWSGYRRQPIIVMDDFAAVNSDPSAEAQLINLVSSTPYPLVMAGLEEKGMVFDSQLIFASTNFLGVSPEAKVRCDEAFRNRRHVLIDVSLKPDCDYDSADFTANQRYDIKVYSHGRYNIVQSFECYGDLLAYCLTRHEEHVKEQEANLAKLSRTSAYTSHFQKFEQVLQLGTYFSASMEKTMREAVAAEEGDDAFYLLYAVPRNGSYLHVASNKKKDIRTWYGPVHPDDQEDILKASERMLMGAYEYLLLSNELNVVVRNHLSDMVCTDNYDDNLGFCGRIGDQVYHQQLIGNINSLKPWHRAILFGIGTLLGIKTPEPWYVRMWESVKNVLYKMYKTEMSEWPVPLKIACGIILTGIVGTSFWKVFSVLSESAGAGLMGVAAASFGTTTVAEAQSRKPNRFDVQQYRYKNVPLKRRAWGDAQMSLDQSSVTLMSKCHAKFNVGPHHVQIVLVPGRRFIGYAHFFRFLTYPMQVQIETDKRTYYHKFDPKNMEYFDDNELCVYYSPSLEDIPHSSWDLYCWDPAKELPKKFQADFISCKYNEMSQLPEPAWATVNVEMKKEDFTICDGEYRNVIPSFLLYDAPTVNKDCGSMILANVSGQMKLVGIHVGGIDGKQGIASLLPPLKPCAQAQGASVFFDFFPVEDEANDGIAMVGQLKPGNYIPLPKKTSLQETPKEWHLGVPCDKVPSILVKNDPRLVGTEHADYDPNIAGLSKYSCPMAPLEGATLGETCQEILDEWFDCLPDGFDLGVVDINEALNGVDGLDYMDRIPLATSEGFPHVMSRKNGEKGKQRFVEGDGHVVSLIPGTSVEKAYNVLLETIADEVPTLVGIECPKDEKLPLRKVYEKPKTRSFTILPMEYNVLVRRYFINFVRFIMKKRDVLPCQVGINPYSMEWTRLAARLKGQGNNVLCCDYSSFDGLLSKQVMEMMADMINKFCGGTVADSKARKNLLMACCSRLAICKDTVWRVECGIPSGFPLTVICNSIFNEILVRYHFKLLLRKQYAPEMYALSFKSLVSMVTYGDDNLISVNAVLKPFFDGTKLKREMAQNGITITDGKDKTSPFLSFRRLEDCDFLKRGFLQRSSALWDAPEEKSSLWAQLHYVNTNNCEMQVAYLTNLVNVLRELYMHDPKEMVDFRRKALKEVSWITSSDLPTVSQIAEFYADQRERAKPDTNDSLDILTCVDLLGPAIMNTKVPQEALKISENFEVRNLSVAGYNKCYNENEIWILFNTMYPQSSLPENAHSFTWTFGAGRGGLPTQGWLSANITRKESKLNKLVRTALASKKKIIVASADNMLPTNIMALLLASRNGVVPTLISNGVLTHVMESAQKLNFLPKECEFAFF